MTSGGVRTLADRRIVITRPAGQAAGLAGMIAARGGVPVLFPVIDIHDLDDPAALHAVIDRLDAFDLAVFVSVNAVEMGMRHVTARRAWPAALAVATVGPGSERALHQHGFEVVIAPRTRFDSEGLLERLGADRVAGRRVVVFRGDGGRELLGDTLVARGATVEYAQCYRRARPDADAGPLQDAAAREAIDAVTVSSSEGLANLRELLGAAGRDWLARTPVFAPHPRIVARARAFGLQRVVETSAADEGLVAGLETFFATVSAP
jgi:uroporphyrinogen-III synthase